MRFYRSTLLTFLAILTLSGCGYRLAGTAQNSKPRALDVAERVSDNKSLQHAMEQLAIEASPAAPNRINDAKCLAFTVEDVGTLQTIDMRCTLELINGNNAPKTLERRRIVRLNSDNNETKSSDRLDAETYIYIEILRNLPVTP